MTFCNQCGTIMPPDQWGHPVHPATRCIRPVSDPAGECLHCHTVFATGHALIVHTNGSCSADKPKPPSGKSLHCQTCSVRHAPCCNPRPQRWPLGPLVEAVAGAAHSAHDVAAALNVSGESLRTAAEFGLSDVLADRWAIRCGLHPAQVWPDWIDAGLTVRDRQFLENGWRPAWEWNEQQTTERTEAAA